MKDVIYEAHVMRDQSVSLGDLGCSGVQFCIGIAAVILSEAGIAGFIVLAVTVCLGIMLYRKKRQKVEKQGVLQRVILNADGVMLRYGRESLSTKTPRCIQIPLDEISEAETPDTTTLILHTMSRAYQLEGVLDARKFADALRRVQQTRRMSQQTVTSPQERMLAEQHIRMPAPPPQTKPAVDPDLQNAMQYMLRTGAITQAQFDTANDPDRPLPPQPAVDADTFHALEYQLQTGMITREQFDAMAYSQQKPAPEPDPLDILAPLDVPDADEQNALAYQQRMQQFGAMMPPDHPDEQERMQL